MQTDEPSLLRTLRSSETTFVERKSAADTQDWVKSVVAFANTLRPEQNGVLFLGVNNKGEIQAHKDDLDSLQRKFAEKTRIIYPECPYYETYEVKDDEKRCLAIVVPGGSRKPYFAGPPYVRVASTSERPSPEQFERLLATRSDKAYQLQQWIDRLITLRFFSRRQGMGYQLDQSTHDAKILDCNQFYVTVNFNNRKWSYPLSRVEIAYDHVRDRLELETSAPPA